MKPRHYLIVPKQVRYRAFSMVEAVVSIMIVGGLLVASMNLAGATALGQQKIGSSGKGMLLAEGLMSEVLRQDYEDLDEAVGSFGLASGKIGDGSRALWNDVDDYDGWSASPPETKDGATLPNLARWQRSVVVEWVNASNLTGVSGTNTGVKRVTVVVFRHGVPQAELVALRAGTPSGLVLDPRPAPEPTID